MKIVQVEHIDYPPQNVVTMDWHRLIDRVFDDIKPYMHRNLPFSNDNQVDRRIINESYDEILNSAN